MRGEHDLVGGELAERVVGRLDRVVGPDLSPRGYHPRRGEPGHGLLQVPLGVVARLVVAAVQCDSLDPSAGATTSNLERTSGRAGDDCVVESLRGRASVADDEDFALPSSACARG